jgi:hypothetical protein
MLAAIFDSDCLPSQRTYRRFSPALHRWFSEQIQMGAVTVDFDSTVMTREASQKALRVSQTYGPTRTRFS